MVKPAKVYLCTAYKALWNIIGLAAILILIIAGILWLKSDEDAKDRLMAKDLITTVLIGVAILLVAAGVVYVITSVTGGPAFDMNVFCP
jgi:type IV secretory pathway VirB2 component (pilin)